MSRPATASVALASIGILLFSAAPAQAAPTIDGQVGLGSAATFGVLSASTVTNTGPTVIEGDVGVSPGTAIVGFPPGIVGGVLHSADAEAAQAQSDLTTAYNAAASLTPTTTGLGELAGLSLTPGVYSGGELALNGELTLAGTAESVWVFQAASTLTAGSSSRITMTGGASACNVFWQVGSSATLGSDAQFVGTVMAQASITAVTGADITGRLLADTGAVTLDTNVITAPVGCDAPTITSAAPSDTTVGEEYSFRVTSDGTPAATYTVTSGALPEGLELDSATGAISGVPTTAGASEFVITASNGTLVTASPVYTLVVAPDAVPEVPEAPVVSPVDTAVPPAVPAAPVTPAIPAAPESPTTPGTPVDSDLPATGAELTVPLLGLGALLLALGGAVLVLRRTRNTRATQR